MNNDLTVQGLKIPYFPPSKQEAFVDEVLEAYFRQCIQISNSTDSPSLPTLAYEYAEDIDREYFAAMISYNQTGDEAEFLSDVNDFDSVGDYFNDLFAHYEDEEYHDMFSNQIISVLDHYHLSHFTFYYAPIRGKGYHIVNNVHFTEVW